jgi:hypothetical protein
LENSGVTVTSGGSNEITISNIPASMGKLANVKFSAWNGRAWVPHTPQQDAAKLNMPGTTAIALESEGKIIRRSTARRTPGPPPPNHVKLPLALTTLTIRNLETGNFGVISDTGDAANGNTNICVHLTFSD